MIRLVSVQNTAYTLWLRLREGYVQFNWKTVTLRDHPAGFWAVMRFLGLCEVIFVGLAVTRFLAWL